MLSHTPYLHLYLPHPQGVWETTGGASLPVILERWSVDGEGQQPNDDLGDTNE